ncbi:MAG: glutathione S-transferase N-terminal domain-containing protein [Moritella sp.]|uniref:glutathione S-transferase N-terminal domain-containing protein n=1 Tax=Moritella sp. TaxID=78556 RepID=UPI001D749264|nr:glutathione S-transferase N-terminal domain-containing protein [Moritella sp.]NQZ41668.1 glutathione S-transferase N-terminal domain-containing protein [Moritella sp.]
MYGNEVDPMCRLVREAISELNLDVLIIPCPKGGDRHIQQLQEMYSTNKIPFLIDKNTQTILNSASEIIDYLYKHYANSSAPIRLRANIFNYASSTSASLLRWNAGKTKQSALEPTDPLVLYSFESSPYSRPVRETLCELELPYLLINLGKQQFGELGPAIHRLSPGEYTPLPKTKRSAFFAEHGTVQVPLLKDPNTDVDMFESKAIVKYLITTYAL